MTGPKPLSLFDPNVLDVPARPQLIGDSPWVAAMPDLSEQALKWLDEVPKRQAKRTARARRLSRPSIDLAMAKGMGKVASKVTFLAVGDVTSTIFRAEHRNQKKSTRSVKRIERLVRAGGPAWVKLGQFIATADGLVPREWVESFAWCRDEAPSLPPEVPRRIIERAFGRSIDQLFAEFDDVPIGAASIAQVHRAVLHDGREVVVKVRRPHLRQRFASDIRAMAGAAWLAERLHPIAKAGNPTGFVELFAELVLEELDFRIEALNMVELGAVAQRAGTDDVLFPRPVPSMVTERVLVMERLPGATYTSVKVDKTVGTQVLRFAIQTVLEHTLIYGVFHGDLHAGNVLLDVETGKLSLVDFGIVGRLSVSQRIALGQFMVGFAQMNVRAQLEAMVEFGAIPRTMDLGILEADIEREVKPHDIADDATIAELTDRVGKLIQVVARHGVSLPKELVLFFKNLLYLNGFAASVAPDANLLGEIVPVFAYFQLRYGDAIDLGAFVAPPASTNKGKDNG